MNETSCFAGNWCCTSCKADVFTIYTQIIRNIVDNKVDIVSSSDTFSQENITQEKKVSAESGAAGAVVDKSTKFNNIQWEGEDAWEALELVTTVIDSRVVQEEQVGLLALVG